ncbi:hypothetical protein [Pseudomonas sp. RIT-PI-AD]|uniref:hypothetical protein n=1 Tax=Pseudomonas sp. RIT-PI-AD TaxID=3035294 RepID=UPI0021DA9CFB|nr:hypothetical protein [Pseudomonas sp. RIT-PI-AD]
MRYYPLIALCAPLLAALPVHAAEWPSGARESFVKECKASAQSNVAGDQLQGYCDCAADKISHDLSEAEIREIATLKTPLPPKTHERLLSISKSCLGQLNPH